VTIRVESRVIEQATQACCLGRGVHTIGLGFVLEKVHVASDGGIARIFGLALLGLCIRDHLAGVFAHKIAAHKFTRGKHATTLVARVSHFEALFALTAYARLDTLKFGTLQIRLALARTLTRVYTIIPTYAIIRTIASTTLIFTKIKLENFNEFHSLRG